MKRNNNEMDENCIRIESNVEKSIELNLSSALTKSNTGSISRTTKFDWEKLNPISDMNYNAKQCLLIYARLYIVYEVKMLMYSLINQILEKCF